MTRGLTAAPPKETGLAAQAAPAPLTPRRVFWLFLIAGVLGDLVEVAFWLLTKGELISRSSLLYGPFSIVWGLGAVLFTLVFHRVNDGSTARIFLLGTVLGGAYEYICACFQERFFGACFWDYRSLPFNLNGKINLVFCLLWGAAAVLWVRAACPALCRFVDRLPRRLERQIAAAAAVFLILSAALSGTALWRMSQRQEGKPALGAVSRFLDEAYPDSVLRQRYPNMGILNEIGWYDTN